jgi:hypothetical protein
MLLGRGGQKCIQNFGEETSWKMSIWNFEKEFNKMDLREMVVKMDGT